MSFKNRTTPGDSLEAGRLSDSLVFQLVSETKTTFGPPTEVPTTAFTIPGEFQALGSREFPASQKRNNESTARFIIRYREGIHAGTHQILFEGRTWNIAEPFHDRFRTMHIIEASVVE